MSDPQQIDMKPAVDLVTKDLRKVVRALDLNPSDMRYIVQAYYQIQDHRKAIGSQYRCATAAGRPADLLEWLLQQQVAIENRVHSFLDAYSMTHEVGVWARGITGIGPVISAALMAWIDIERCPTAGHLWSYAGLIQGTAWMSRASAKARLKGRFTLLDAAERLGCDPRWLARRVYRRVTKTDLPFVGMLQRIPDDATYVSEILRGVAFDENDVAEAVARPPWNPDLKRLCWSIGECFVRQCRNPKCWYGQLYARRKSVEAARNAAGEYADQAAASLKALNYKRSTTAFKEYSKGRLPAAHIHARARRYAVKMFLAHWHHKAYVVAYGREPPLPYPVAFLGHAHVLAAPDSFEE